MPPFPLALGLALLCALSLALAGAVSVNDVDASLRFPRLKHTFQDDWKEFAGLPGPKLKRWTKENGTLEHAPVNMEEVTVHIQPADEKDAAFSLFQAGFERVELHPRILPLLRQIKQHGLSGNRVGPTTGGNLFFGGGPDEEIEDKLARVLQGTDSFSLGGNVRHYAFRCSGFVIRKGGPEGSQINGSGFDQVAQRVHIDQDLTGEPLIRMGLTWVFRLPYMFLINVWSPLHDIRMRPMAFVDQRTVNMERDVLRYRTNSTANAGGRFGSFASDRLMSLHHADHKWYWFPDARFGQAIAWNTGTVPHSSFSLPGENVLTVIRKQLEALAAGDKLPCTEQGAAQVMAAFPKKSAVTLDMEAQIGAAQGFVRRVCEGRASKTETDYMLEYLTRASLEIRCVTMVVPEATFQAARAVGVSVACVLAATLWRRRSSIQSR